MIMANRRQKLGFTLVELMVVIVIIGILAAIAIPAISRAITTGRQTAMRMEINSLEQAVENYRTKYGDYPPDGSDAGVAARHMRKLRPRISEPDATLYAACINSMDAAEALVFFLGGFSSDELHPLTGPGGPLEYVSGDIDNISSYQYNATRDNSFFDFDPARLTYGRASDNDPLRSVDEGGHGSQGTADLLPIYLSSNREGAPIVYFDSRTYGRLPPIVPNVIRYNGYENSSYGSVRPMKSGRDIKPPAGSSYGSADAAFAAVPFHNPNSFQILSPGLDGHYGGLVLTQDGTQPVHFITQNGAPVWPNAAATNPRELVYSSGAISTRYQDGSSELPMLDNITNFTTSILEDELE